MGDRRRIGPVDTVWLSMDRANNLMVIDSIMWCDGKLDLPRLRTLLQHRLLDRYPVFSQRPTGLSTLWGSPQWEDDPEFSLDRHLCQAALPLPGDEVTLREFIEAQMSRPLDRLHPLWEMHLIEGYEGGGSVIMTRFHHALADGIALAQVLVSLTDETADADLEDLDRDESPETAHATVGLMSRAGGMVRLSSDMVRAAPHFVDPSAAIHALTVARETLHIADKLLLGNNPDTPLSGTPGERKRAVWSRPWSVADVKSVARLSGATINDVLVSAVSGALTTYLVDHGGEPTDLTTMVPVNLRPVGQPLPAELGNRFALVMLPMPTGVRAPLQRLAETKRRMDRIKASPEPVLTYAILNAIGRVYPDVARQMVDFFAAKAIGVTTNVAGPLAGRYLAGAKIVGVLGWVPGSGDQTVGVCIFSYDRFVRVGFKVDATVVCDAESLVDSFDDEMHTMLRMAAAR